MGRGENVSYVNCYSLRGSQVNSISEEAVASGDLCYKLNGNSFANPAFYQTLDEDNYPVLDPTHGLVYTLDGENYSDIHDEASFKNFTKEVAENAEEMTTKVVTKSLLDEFQEAMTALKAITEREAYLEQYFALQGKACRSRHGPIPTILPRWRRPSNSWMQILHLMAPAASCWSLT